MAKMSKLDWLSIALLVVGGLNWALFGIFGFNLVALLGAGLLAKIVYGLIGLSALYSVVKLMLR